MNGKVGAFLNLTQFRFKDKHEIEIFFTIDTKSFTESLPVLEGGMRLRLPEEITREIILALRNGKKVSILVDGFEQTLVSDLPISFEGSSYEST